MLGFSALSEYALSEVPPDAGGPAAAVTGTGVVTLDFSVAAAGVQATTGTASVTLTPSAAAAGVQAATGTGAASQASTVAAAGAHGIAGVGAATLTGAPVAAAIHQRYEVRGQVKQSGILVNRRVRVHLRSSGALIAEADTTAGTFRIHTGFAAAEHYIVPINLDDAATDWLPPTANRVVSVLAQDA